MCEEWLYRLETLIDVRGDRFVAIYGVGWGRISQVVGEIGGEVYGSQCNLGVF